MRKAAGQAARHTGRLLRLLLEVALALAVLAAVGGGLMVWRLSARPFASPWLTRQLEKAANGDPRWRVGIGEAALAWEGFHAGIDQPLDIGLSDVTLTSASGRKLASLPHVRVTLSPLNLLRGEVVPRTLVIDGASVHLIRQADGSLVLDDDAPAAHSQAALPDDLPGGPAAWLRELARPPQGGMSAPGSAPWRQVRHLGLRDASFSIADRALGAAWQGRDIAVDLRRGADGALDGQIAAAVTAGAQTARLALHAAVPPGAPRATLVASLSAVDPAKLATVFPAASGLAALAAPVTLAASVQLDAALQPDTFSARAEIGAGTLYAGTGHAPLQGAVITATGSLQRMQATLERLDLLPRPGAPHTILQGRAELVRTGGGYRAGVTLDLDRIAFADLPLVWPEGTGGKGARPWIVQNLTDGQLHDGHFEVSLEAPGDLSDLTLTRAAGGVTGEDVTIHWLRPVPPLEHAGAKLTLVNPDTLAIDIAGARQAGGALGGLHVLGGRLTMSGLAGREQYADIDAQVSGPVPDLLTLLRHPRVKLLDRSPLKLTDASGQVAGKVTLTHLPLRDAVTMDDVQLRTSVKLSDLHVAGLAAGRDVDHGALTLDANPNGLQAKGTVEVAGVAANATLDMDFRHGPPTQVTQTVTAAATLDERKLAAFGLDPHGLLTGPADVSATLTLQRNGQGEVSLRGDLGKAALAFEKLGFAKPPGQPATLEARVVLNEGQMAGIDGFRLEGASLSAAGEASFRGGRPDVVHIAKLVLGHDIDAHGEIHVPQADGAPWVASLAGRSMDASAEFKRDPNQPPPKRPAPAGPPYRIDAAFDRMKVADGHVVEALALHLDSDGKAFNRAKIAARTDAKSPFEFTIEPHNGARQLSGSAADAGAVLRAFGLVGSMQGGKLTLSGLYDDTRPDRKLTGRLEIDDYRIRNAPILARLLQAMTLYGLVEVTRGPGLGFAKLIAPFTLADDVLELQDARAYSSSLGMTAKGQIDLTMQTAALQGTIVPAYFFNSLLSDVPLIGKLFVPEHGGGVFAATYGVHGPLDDPDVAVNPLAALTPGFLRQFFDLFDAPAAK